MVWVSFGVHEVGMPRRNDVPDSGTCCAFGGGDTIAENGERITGGYGCTLDDEHPPPHLATTGTQTLAVWVDDRHLVAEKSNQMNLEDIR